MSLNYQLSAKMGGGMQKLDPVLEIDITTKWPGSYPHVNFQYGVDRKNGRYILMLIID